MFKKPFETFIDANIDSWKINGELEYHFHCEFPNLVKLVNGEIRELNSKNICYYQDALNKKSVHLHSHTHNIQKA
jgi:hypothetical protein